MRGKYYTTFKTSVIKVSEAPMVCLYRGPLFVLTTDSFLLFGLTGLTISADDLRNRQDTRKRTIYWRILERQKVVRTLIFLLSSE